MTRIENQFSLSNCDEGDIGNIHHMEMLATPYVWTQKSVEQSILGAHHCYKLTKIDGIGIYGYCVLQVVDSEMEVLNIVVRKDFQHMGIGRFLLESVLDLPQYRLVDNIWLEVRESNEGALRLYRKLGFSQVGRRKGYYPLRGQATNGREDAIVMHLGWAPSKSPKEPVEKTGSTNRV